jgi:hypothetical protein
MIAWLKLALVVIGSAGAATAVMAAFALDRIQSGEANKREARRRGEQITP